MPKNYKTKPSLLPKESSYTIKFDFLSYDPLPTLDDITSAVDEGIRDEFPNCSINITNVSKE